MIAVVVLWAVVVMGCAVAFLWEMVGWWAAALLLAAMVGGLVWFFEWGEEAS